MCRQSVVPVTVLEERGRKVAVHHRLPGSGEGWHVFSCITKRKEDVKDGQCLQYYVGGRHYYYYFDCKCRAWLIKYSFQRCGSVKISHEGERRRPSVSV